MDRAATIAWVVLVCRNQLRLSQANTLGSLVAATLSAMRLSLAGIGRELAAGSGGSGGAAKHAIKRVWRFCRNERVEPAQVMPAAMTALLRRRLKWHAKKPDRRPLLVSLDWTKIRSFHVLMAAIVVEGRALPLCWESYAERIGHKSQNALEYAMLAAIRAALPQEVPIVILADRGFGRAQMAIECQKLGLDYLIRVEGKVHVRTRRWHGLLKHYAIKRGQCHGFADALYRRDGVASTNLIVRWKKGLPQKKDGPWYLMTSLPLGGKSRNTRLSDLYAKRFDIEELFRDAKNEHLGWSLARTQISRADRLDRLILIAALAYLLLVALGLWCRANRKPRLWCTNKRERELSCFAIARVMLGRLQVPLPPLLALLTTSLATTDGKWG